MTQTIKDAEKNHWVYSMPESWRHYLQLARYDRPIGYWLLTLPGWIALAFASLSHGLAWTDLKWAGLILVGAIAMRGAGCTYNDIVDRDLDAQVDRTALRPIPAGTINMMQASLWLAAQCFVGLIVLLCMPRLAQIISLASIPLVAAYPFMKRITWWPQVWLGMTFNWAALVAYAAKTGEVSPGAIILYVGLIFWTIGYDTIYACQDIEDDAFVGIKSTARRFGKHVKLGVGVSYAAFFLIILLASRLEVLRAELASSQLEDTYYVATTANGLIYLMGSAILIGLILLRQVIRFNQKDSDGALKLFKSNMWLGLVLTAVFINVGIQFTPM